MNFNKYIGLPFKHRGKCFKGVDCWNLLRLIFKEERGIELPDFTKLMYSKNWYKNNKNHIISNKNTVSGTFWEEVKQPYVTYDALLFYLSSKNIINHIGMYYKDNMFIHIYEGSGGSCIDKLNRPYWKSRLYMALRYIK